MSVLSLPLAVERANKWVDAAKPIILAMFALEETGDGLFAMEDRRLCEEARDHIEKARKRLFDMLDGIRDNFRCDHAHPQPEGDDEAAWDACEEFNDALDRELISVSAAITKVQREDRS